MDNRESAGYQEIEHTADWELAVWAPDLVGLLAQAALGMYALSKTELAQGSRQWRDFSVPYQDAETLLVDFLSELLFLGETETLGFDIFQFEIQEGVCHCKARGAPLISQGMGIKAVTYHQMMVEQDERGFRVHIVFDV